MEIRTVKLGLYQTNCYILVQDGHAVIVDPGAKLDRLNPFIEGLEIDAILLTHGHFDHIGIVDELYDIHKCPVYIHEEDEHFVRSSQSISNRRGEVKMTCPVQYFNEGILKIKEFTFEIYFTPGHSDGSICIQWSSSLFTGDTLFKQDVGRTDLETGSERKQKETLKLLKTFNETFVVYPGHGEATTMKDELLYNTYLKEV